MNLQTRKLNIIEYLIGIKDEDIFSKIESTIIESKKKSKQTLKPFTKKQLIERAERSNKDYATGKFKTQQLLEKESENW